MYIAPSSGHTSFNFNMPFKLILRRCEVVSNVWSENTALFERLMEIHSNSPKLYYGFKERIGKCQMFWYSTFPIKIKMLHSILLPRSLNSLSILHSQCTFPTPKGAFYILTIKYLNLLDHQMIQYEQFKINHANKVLHKIFNRDHFCTLCFFYTLCLLYSLWFWLIWISQSLDLQINGFEQFDINYPNKKLQSGIRSISKTLLQQIIKLKIKWSIYELSQILSTLYIHYVVYILILIISNFLTFCSPDQLIRAVQHQLRQRETPGVLQQAHLQQIWFFCTTLCLHLCICWLISD